VKYAFIDRHAVEHPVRRLCAVMAVHLSGYYAWKRQPESARSRQDRLLTPLIRQCWEESGRVYGYRKIRDDLRDLGERCGKHRVARLMRHAGLRSHTGYGRRPGMRGGKASVVAPNHLQRQFEVSEPNKA
jgi:putative transposase